MEFANFVAILPAIALLLATGLLLLSLVSLWRKVAAERKYLRYLKGTHLVDEMDCRFDSTIIDSETLQKTIKELEEAAKGLSSEDRKYILDSLNQESLRGRARYTDKLLEKARAA